MIANGAAYLTDIYTEALGRNGAAVGLVDGFAERDYGDSQWKARREAYFPEQLLVKASQFALAKAVASEKKDKDAILAAVGDKAQVLEATVRARFGCARVGALLKRDSARDKLRALLGSLWRRLYAPDQLLELLRWLRASELRKLSAYGEDLDASDADRVAQLLAALPAALQYLLLEEVPLAGQGAGLAGRVGSGQLLHLHLKFSGLGAAEAVSLADGVRSAGATIRTLALMYALQVGRGRGQ